MKILPPQNTVGANVDVSSLCSAVEVAYISPKPSLLRLRRLEQRRLFFALRQAVIFSHPQDACGPSMRPQKKKPRRKAGALRKSGRSDQKSREMRSRDSQISADLVVLLTPLSVSHALCWYSSRSVEDFHADATRSGSSR